MKTKTVSFARFPGKRLWALAAGLLVGASLASAQQIIPPPSTTSSAPRNYSVPGQYYEPKVREGLWDFYFFTQYWSENNNTVSNMTRQVGAGPNPPFATHDLHFDFEDEFVWGFGFGYNVNEHLNVNFEFAFGYPDYEASWGDAVITGEAWVQTGSLALDYNILKKKLTPFVSLGIGYNYIDTGIPSSAPGYYCWWDYWWGYVCDGYVNTYTKTYFTAQAAAGLRWDPTDRFFIKLSATSYWVDVSNDVDWMDSWHYNLSVGWKY